MSISFSIEAGGKINMNTKKSKTKGKVLTKRVLFEFLAPEAREVCLAGD